jgi:ABC-type transport system substrate-binding protein
MTNYTINPDPYYTPKISIGPFSLSKYTKSDYCVLESNPLDVLGKNLKFTSSGKQSIELALLYLGIKPDDKIGIVTTSRNSYVSKCVTETIAKFCKWEMGFMQSDLTSIFIVHEFGTIIPLSEMEKIRSRNLPIVNDFAYSFLTLFRSARNDFLGEINLTSFPKTFNINFGGCVSFKDNSLEFNDTQMKSKIYDALGYDLSRQSINENFNQRVANRNFYKLSLESIGYQVLWDQEEICPGVCMISPSKPLDLQELKHFLQRNGIECSVFYGKPAFFVPVHHLMTEYEISYVCFMIKAFDGIYQ